MVTADRVRVEAEDEAARLAAVMADGQQFIGWPVDSSSTVEDEPGCGDRTPLRKASTMHKIKFLVPGMIVSEGGDRVIPERTVEAALAAVPENAFAFSFYDVADEVPDLGPEFKVIATSQNKSGLHYIDGTLHGLSEIEGMGDEYRILASNMRCNGWDTVVKCRTGNFQPFTPGEDHLVSTKVASL